MPKLSVFPKCYMDELCVTKKLTLFDWIELAATLEVDGVEMYPGFFQSFEPEYLSHLKTQLCKRGLEAPMMCASPDFTTPDAQFRRAEVERQKKIIDVTAQLGGKFCRVLSGQRRPDVSRADGVRWTVESIRSSHAWSCDLITVCWASIVTSTPSSRLYSTLTAWLERRSCRAFNTASGPEILNSAGDSLERIRPSVSESA